MVSYVELFVNSTSYFPRYPQPDAVAIANQRLHGGARPAIVPCNLLELSSFFAEGGLFPFSDF